MHLAIAAAGYDKFCATHSADISFPYLICHVFRYLLCYCDESIIFLLKPQAQSESLTIAGFSLLQL